MKTILFALLFVSLTVAQNSLDRIIAVVDREVITESDLNFTVQQLAVQNRVDPTSKELRDRVLDGMINDKLVLAQAIEDSIIVSDEEVTERLEQQISKMMYQIGGQQKMEEMYGMTVNRMKRDFQFRELVRKQMLVQKIQQQRQAQLTVSRREVEDFFNTYKDSIPKIPREFDLSHIYIEPKPDSSVLQLLLMKAQQIADSVKVGGDFSDFAKRYSSDGSASQGGDLGFARRGSFVKEFEEVAFTLTVGEISKPVKTQFGYHIIQLVERRGDAVRTRHILFPVQVSQTNDDSTIAQLNRVRQQALLGENFGVLARKYSEDNDTKDIGGDLGKVAIDQLDPAYEDFVKSAKTGDISEPRKLTVQNKYGYHIIFVRSITEEHMINLAGDFKRLEQLALQFKLSQKYEQWVENLRKTIYWEKKL
ncbi:MAG TPA: parvulin peptidyl-prolyl isomerase [Bacteroidetes bacterium]|nr:parvulin peptidyl-prolyl isomerase [Bacteroidota bacterium]